MPISWQIPNATKLFHAARAKGVPIDAIGDREPAHQAILEIARALRPFPAAEEAKPRKGLLRGVLLGRRRRRRRGRRTRLRANAVLT